MAPLHGIRIHDIVHACYAAWACADVGEGRSVGRPRCAKTPPADVGLGRSVGRIRVGSGLRAGKRSVGRGRTTYSYNQLRAA